MRLIVSLTTLTAAALCMATLTSCAGSAPRKPASTTDKNTSIANDPCYEAQARNAPPPVGCPQTTQTRRARTLPDIDRDAILVPTAPNTGGLPGGGILGR